MLMLLSASEGRISTTAYEWRCIATEQLGVSFSRSKMLKTRTSMLLPELLPTSPRISLLGTVVRVNHLHEVSDNERYSLDPLDLLAGPDKLFLQYLVFFPHEVLLQLQEVYLGFQVFELEVQLLIGPVGVKCV